jgi:hypothetical protein
MSASRYGCSQLGQANPADAQYLSSDILERDPDQSPNQAQIITIKIAMPSAAVSDMTRSNIARTPASGRGKTVVTNAPGDHDSKS